ncbi:MAG TPA: Cj0069 family protein [Steroidobacteraceae bacterium]|nr:Cj0069 family protein [Steroidobacteraceae bacterium]
MNGRPLPRIALLSRDQPTTRERLQPLLSAFDGHGVDAEPVVYCEEWHDAARARLLHCDGVLVWVDPISDGRDRTRLDPMLSEVASQGIWVSAHPNVIVKMGTKEVLYHTRRLGWGTDTHLYRTCLQFEREFPQRLAEEGSRVLKQCRGNGGIGTWRVQCSAGASSCAGGDLLVWVQEATRGSLREEMRLGEFMQRCQTYFSARGGLIDQRLATRASEGMIRCYLVHDRVVGFSTQRPVDGISFAMAREKTFYAASESRFRTLRAEMEHQWVPHMQQILALDTGSLPVIWDADFFLGPRTERGEDTYVLCEINVSSVSPFPDAAVPRIAEAAAHRVLAASEASRDA